MANPNQRVYKNTTKKLQVIYDRYGNAIEVKPGQTFIEDMTDVIDIQDLLKKEQDRRATQNDADQMKEIKKKLDLVKAAKTTEELQPLKKDETNMDVIDAIMLREQELLRKEIGKKK